MKLSESELLKLLDPALMLNNAITIVQNNLDYLSGLTPVHITETTTVVPLNLTTTTPPFNLDLVKKHIDRLSSISTTHIPSNKVVVTEETVENSNSSSLLVKAKKNIKKLRK
jgi:hypothetical protein